MCFFYFLLLETNQPLIYLFSSITAYNCCWQQKETRNSYFYINKIVKWLEIRWLLLTGWFGSFCNSSSVVNHVNKQTGSSFLNSEQKLVPTFKQRSSNGISYDLISFVPILISFICFNFPFLLLELVHWMLSYV